MPRIRKIEIERFRGIRELIWCPAQGINCLIGAGDTGKSTVLEAVDLCLGARRALQFSDADFFQLDVTKPISIAITIGELTDSLKSLDSYGMYLRGFDASSGELEDEPEKGLETVLTVRLAVSNDLEPVWSLASERAATDGSVRSLSWSDRLRLSPTRLGVFSEYHLGWRKGSVLNRLSDERADSSAELAEAARQARTAFGQQAGAQLGHTLELVGETAKELGINVGDVTAMLDAQSVSFNGGTISLHDQDGIPLSSMGIGSIRLLTAGLQRKASAEATIILIDELEYGLEPHRIIRLLGSLGAKEAPEPLQVFMTTHSPVVIRELSGDQVLVMRRADDDHRVIEVGSDNDVQSTLRLYPDAFLASSVAVCEGASEVGLIRGIDQHRVAVRGRTSITAHGTSLVDCSGGDADRPFAKAAVFASLGYRVAVVRDDDKSPSPKIESHFIASGGQVFAWQAGRALEDELFLSVADDTVLKLLDRATELHGEELVDEHIKSASMNRFSLSKIRSIHGAVPRDVRVALGRAARTKRSGWFKSVTWMEGVGRDIVGPDLARAQIEFRKQVAAIFQWSMSGQQA